ncbi:zinc-binding dehydrogenase [Actinomycetospora lutea]|uniref:zinc-binding dehydrogenase n=1 Tax=Actinomycetospora lutea TaxID=663604 RepID=UPI002366975C|nr:zinc-binding dehydrogenase [Actinomycetospora lutea]MDD7939100.1 zinc-binding dehydrogenase [Actinomycetospora lutea]
MVLPAAAAMPVPDGWTDEQALGLVVNRPTALAALRLGGVAAGRTVLVHAAAGATGQAAVTIARHVGATVIATASPGKHATVLARGAHHVLDSRGDDIAREVRALTDGAGVDLVLESAGGAGFAASLAAAKRVTGRVVVFGLAGGEASLSNWGLVYEHQVHVIGLNLGVLIRAAPQVLGEVMAELSALLAGGVLTPGRPTVYDLADGARALTDLEARSTVGKLALLP